MTYGLWVLALGLLATPATRSMALDIGAGWSADMPAGVTYTAVTGAGTSGDSFKFTVELASKAGVSTTIKFTNTGTPEGDQHYFNLSFKGTNTGKKPWGGLKLVIDDKTEDPLLDEPLTEDHPSRAHIHRSSWNAGTASHFKCDDSFCDFDGRYDMLFGLKDGAMPITMGNMTTGGVFRLHDVDESPAEGMENKPMKFDLTLTPIGVPEPGTLTLVALALPILVRTVGRRVLKAA